MTQENADKGVASPGQVQNPPSMKSTLVKGCLAIVTGLTVLLGACVGGLFLWVAVATQDSAEAADSFLALLAEGETHDAYLSAAAELRSTQGEQAFAAIVDRLGLADYEMEAWTDRTLEGETVTVYRATVSTMDGPIAVVLEMRKVASVWKVFSFTDMSRMGVGPGAWFRMVPTDEELRRLATEALVKFDRGVKAADLGEFYESLAPDFQFETNLETLQFAHRRLIDGKADLSAVAVVDPVFDKPARLLKSKYGDFFLLSGRYPIEPAPVTFKLKFLYRHPEWKLYTHTIKVEDS